MSQLNFLGEEDQPASPIRRQYLDIKRRYPGALLFFRLGDFYETFDDDARIVSSELDIVLTGREMGRGERVPLAGIPYHAVEGYVSRLIAKGYRIAICEQVGSPVKGLMPREVVRVITPGTLVEDSLLPPRSNNFLASLYPSREGVGLALVDISTGDFLATEIQAEDWAPALAAELERLRPAECLLPTSASGDPSIASLVPQGSYPTARDDVHFGDESSNRVLKEHFGVATLDGLGLTTAPLATRAAGGVITYLRETQPASLGQLKAFHLYSLDQYMKLDATARRHLELTANANTGQVDGSLLWVLDRTRTAMGGRLLRRWIGQPLLDLDAINRRLDGVEELAGSPLGRAEIAEALSHIADLERLASRASQRSLSPRDCLAMARSLGILPRLSAILQQRAPMLFERDAGSIDPCPDVEHLITSTIADNPAATVGEGVIRDGRSQELDELREITGNTRQWIARLERSAREQTGIRSLKIGFNKVFGYYIEVGKASLEAPADEFARQKTGASTIAELLDRLGYQRKQTIANGERFVTAQLKEQELKLQNAQDEILALEKRLYSELVAEVAGAAERMRRSAQAIARLDVLLSLAEVAVANRYSRPLLDDSVDLYLMDARHPVVERTMAVGEYVPNDCRLSEEEGQIAILTGPNMAGKSTYLLGVALVVLMAQMGSFVPAVEARIGVVDRVFTRIGAQHDVTSGKSTFLVEMAETANMLHNATPRSLVVLDEIGRGTSTYDGMAIARAVVESLHDNPRLRCRTLFATHYHELSELKDLLARVRNLRMEVLEEGDRVVFLHRIAPGGADRSYGIHVAQLAGVPAPVVRRAREILRDLEAMRDGPTLGVEARAAAGTDGASDGLLEEIRELDISRMTPLQALAKLNELQQRICEMERRSK